MREGRLAHPRSAAALLSGVGLMADGPIVWGRPVPARGPGVYVVELPAPLPKPPIELAKVGKWIERVPSLRLDGERPTSKALAARIASFWLPGEVVLYVGMSAVSLGGRVAAYYQTPLGDRRPHAGGHWLKTFERLDGLRIWWAETAAAEEYEDAVLSALADGVDAATRAGLPDHEVVLPFANLQAATGERKRHGITGAVLVESEPAKAPPTVVQVAPGDADGTSRDVKGTGTVRAARRPGPRPAAPPRSRGTASPRAAGSVGAQPPRVEVVDVTAEALERLKAERHELTHVRRPEVVARIKSARELGDLRENAEYHAAREEQSFLEGRIQLLDGRIRRARLIETAPAGAGDRVRLGSAVTVEHDGETLRFTVVGSTEADPSKGRISSSSPVGAAPLGREVGADVDVRTPRGAARYRILGIA